MQKIVYIYRELNQARPKPDTVDQPVRTARTFVHHYSLGLKYTVIAQRQFS